MEHWELNHWMSFWAILVALLGVLASTVFSFLLWHATKRSTKAAELSAAAAIQSIELSKQLDIEIHNARHDQALYDLKLQAITIMSEFMAFHASLGELGVSANTKPQLDPVLKQPAISYQRQYFSPEETQIIDHAWQTLVRFSLKYPVFIIPNSKPAKFIYNRNQITEECYDVIIAFEKVTKL